VGRERELDQLDEVLSQTLEGHGACTLVLGEAGIGKTRLLEELAERARARGFSVAWGRGWELGRAPSLWPWLEILRTLLERPLAPPASARRLRSLLPELEPAVGAFSPDVFQLYDAVQSYLQAHAQLEPLALFIDDLHVVDDSSLVLGEFVARGLARGRVALFGSQRLDGQSPELEQRASRLARAGEHVALAPLTCEAVRAWMQHVAAGADIDTARRIHEASDGNPLFVSELLRMPELTSHGPLAPLPLTLRALIRERLGSLRAEHVPVLRAAALIGRQFTLPVLAEVAELDLAELEAAAHEASRSGVLVAIAPSHFRFSHALVAETLALDLLPAERRQLHRRAAEALERRHSGDPRAPVNEIARHWLAAGVEAAPLAAAAAERAAFEAVRRFAFADAALLYQRALEALELCAPVDSGRQGDLYVAQIEALSRAGRRERAELVCSRAVDLARARRDGPLLARAALALGSENHLGKADLTVARLLERALAALPPGDGDLRALVSARLASARQPELDPEPPMALARQAIAMVRRLAAPALSLQVIHAALGALMDFAAAEERAALNAEALELATRLGDHPRALQAAQRLAFDCLELADLDGFGRALARYEALATEVEQPRYAWVPAMFGAMRADWLGERERAELWEAEARALREQGNAEGAALVPARALARALLHTDVELLGRFVNGLLERAPQSSGGLWLSALLAAWRGQHDGARQALDVLSTRGLSRLVGRAGATGGDAPDASNVGSMEASHAVGLGYLHMPEVAVELACHLGDVAWAEALYTELSASSGKPFLLTTLGFSLHGAVDHALMRLSAVRREWDVARRHAGAALELCARLRARPLLLRIHLDAARLAHAEREHARSEDERARLDALAIDHRQRAEAVARELGGRELLERCARLGAGDAAGPPVSAALMHGGDGTPPGDAGPRAPERASDATRESGPGGTDETRAGANAALQLTLDGEYWTVSADRALCRVRDSRGIRMLAQLLDQPGREIHVLDLSGSPGGADPSDAGEVLDARARAEYQRRLSELRSEMSEASSFNDLGRQQRLAEEAEALMRELSRGFGLGGRARRSGSAVERARVNVRRRITLALRRIRAASPELGERLEKSVRTGVFCVYRPGSREAS
jgi:hypothetical protein